MMVYGMKLVIAEKPDAAEKIAEFLGCKPENFGQINGWRNDEYIVVAARGHLLNAWLRGLNQKLPATEIYWRPTSQTKQVLDGIGQVFSEYVKDVDHIIIATDNDREGEVIGERIYAYLVEDLDRIHLPIQRWYFSALIESELQKGFDNIGLMDEAQLAQGHARNIADTLIGLNLTKALTKIFKANFPGLTQGISLGRVQSPLLAYLNRSTGIKIRDKPEVEKTSVQDEDCYIDFGDFQVKVSCKHVEGRNEVELLRFKEEVETKKQAERFPNTDDVISDLPFNPETTMSIMEALYLQGYITYPRTKSHYVPLDFAEMLEEALKAHAGMRDTFNISHMVKVPRDERKMAIVPTPEGVEAYNKKGLSTAEKIVLGWLITRAIRGFAPPLRFRNKIAVFDGFEIKWRSECENPEDAITYISRSNYPDISPGKYRVLRIRNVKEQVYISKGYDVSIRHYNQHELVDWLKWHNLGTEATRYQYPSLLQQRSYTNAENIPTKLGNLVANVIESIGLDEYLTSRMERKIEEIQKIQDLEPFTDYIIDVTEEYLAMLENNSWKIEIRCPKDHVAELRNTRYGLLTHCKECGKFNPI